MREGDAQNMDRPFFFGGYGHFQQVIEDLPNFADLGTTLIQDGRHGPAQGLSTTALTPAAREVKQQLAGAAPASSEGRAC